MPVSRLPILYEDNHLLVVDKPAGLPTQGALDDEPSVLDAAKDYVKRTYNKPGNVFLGVVSRLDRLTTGVLVFARTSKAAARLSEQFRDRTATKVYWALVERPLPTSSGTAIDWIAKDDAARRMRKVSANSPGAQRAELSWKTLRRTLAGEIVEIALETGRKHQIRAQLATRGSPVLGDEKYGGRRTETPGIALHSRILELTHPTRGERLTFTAELPDWWEAFGAEA